MTTLSPKVYQPFLERRGVLSQSFHGRVDLGESDPLHHAAQLKQLSWQLVMRFNRDVNGTNGTSTGASASCFFLNIFFYLSEPTSPELVDGTLYMNPRVCITMIWGKKL